MDVTREQRAVQLADLDRRMRDETEREAVLARRAPDWYPRCGGWSNTARRRKRACP
jgi:hypothetical protein